MADFRYALVGDPGGPSGWEHSVQSDRVRWLLDDSLFYPTNHPDHVQNALGTMPRRTTHSPPSAGVPIHERAHGRPFTVPKALSGMTPGTALTIPSKSLHQALDVVFTDLGPFEHDRRSGGDIVLKRRPHHGPTGRWGAPGNVDSVTFRIFPSQHEAVEALLGQSSDTRAVDFFPAISDPEEVLRVVNCDHLFWQDIYGLNIQYLGFVTGRGPFKNKELRKQVVQALDVPRMLTAAGLPEAWEAHGPLPPRVPGYDPTLVQLPHASLRIASVEPVTLAYNELERVDQALANAVQTQLGTAGLVVNLNGQQGYRAVVRAVESGPGGMFLYNWHIKAPHAERILNPLFHRDSTATNLTGYDGADTEINAVLSDPDNTQSIRTAVNRVLNDAPMVFLYHAVRTAAWRNNVRNLILRSLDGQPQDKLATVEIKEI